MNQVDFSRVLVEPVEDLSLELITAKQEIERQKAKVVSGEKERGNLTEQLEALRKEFEGWLSLSQFILTIY